MLQRSYEEDLHSKLDVWNGRETLAAFELAAQIRLKDRDFTQAAFVMRYFKKKAKL